jgi:hypothetical protein
VGAFFAGLGLNRLVPNEGPLMERIDFFGSAVFVPIFLVSVGMLLQPKVMVQGETLKLAGLFILAAIGGKALAALITRRPLKLTFGESALMLGMTLPQAAATLAATVIGFNIGLFDQSVVNAVLVLILVTIIVATVVTDRAKLLVTPPRVDHQALGKRVLVALEEPGQAQVGFTIGARVAAPDSGLVRALLSSPPLETRERQASLPELHRVGFAVGVDVDPSLLVTTSLAEGVINVVAEQDPSLVVVGQRTAAANPALGGSGEAVAATVTVPVVILVGQAERIGEVVLVDAAAPSGEGGDGQTAGAAAIAAELAARVGGKSVKHRSASDYSTLGDLRPGQLCIAPVDSWQVMAAQDPPPGAALMMVLEPPPLVTRDEHAYL